METVRTLAHASQLQIVLELCALHVTLLLPLEITEAMITSHRETLTRLEPFMLRRAGTPKMTHKHSRPYSSRRIYKQANSCYERISSIVYPYESCSCS